MPKEAFKTEDEKVVVGWSKQGQYVEIGVSLGKDTKIQVIQFDENNEIKFSSFYDDLFATFDNEKDFKKFVKALERAGKHAFKS